MTAPTPTTHATTLGVLTACVAHGLPAAARQHLPTEPHELTTDVVSLACRHKVQGLLWSAIADGVVVGNDAVTAHAREATLAALRTCLLSEQTAALALEALHGAGIEARALKGLAIAHLDHDDPAERIFGDADLLIRRRDHGAALAALTAAGFRRARPPVTVAWEQRFAKAVVLIAPSGGELDLHLAVAGGYFGAMIDHDGLWAGPGAPFPLAGVTARGLDTEGRLLHACCHAVLGGASGLRVRRDIAQLVLVRQADWRAVVASAERDGAEHVLAAAVRTTWADLGLRTDHELAEWARTVRPDPRQQRALATYDTGSTGTWGPEARGTLAALGPADRLRFLTGLARRSPASRRARGRTLPGHLGAGLRVLLRRR